MAGTFTVAVENDWILTETGVDNLLLEDGSTNLLTESNTLVDLTPYMLYDSLSLKVNTLDFSLLNPPAFSLHLKEELTTANPFWSGIVTAVESSDFSGVPGVTRVRSPS